MNIYPGVSERIKAMVIDSIVLVIYFIVVSGIVQGPDFPWTIRITFFILVFLYEPLTTTLLGGTIGHLVVGIRVRKFNNEYRNIGIIPAIFRSLLKFLLGWLSFIFMSFDTESRAIHDLAAGSLVIYKKSE